MAKPIWRRVHQLPGVLICPVHRNQLVHTTVPYRSPRRHDFVAASLSIANSGGSGLILSAAQMDRACDLAERSAELCDPKHAVQRSPVDYRPELRQLGYVGVRGSGEALQKDFKLYAGTALLQTFFRSGSDASTWLMAASRAPRRALHPLQHVMLTSFMALQATDSRLAGEPPRVRRRRQNKSTDPSLRAQAAQLAGLGYGPCAIARVLEVDRQTAKRLLAPVPSVNKPERDVTTERKQWLTQMKEHPTMTRTELRQLDRALYAVLYRWDRAWLFANGPILRTPVRTHLRVDWQRRDAALEEAIRAEAVRIAAARPVIRISESRLLGRLSARAALTHNGDKLPRAQVALLECCENVETFQLRRISTVLDASPDADTMPDWAVLRSARINPSRHQDGARGLLDRARRANAASHSEL